MKIRIIVNSSIGEEKINEVVHAVNDSFVEHDACFEFTGYKGHAEEIGRRAAIQKCDVVVAAGGDGTVNEVINGIAGSDSKMGILPVGTANDLAEFYSVPRDLHAACEVIKHGFVQFPDLILVNNSYYATAGGLGFPAKVVKIVNKIKTLNFAGNILKELFGRNLYILSIVISLLSKNAFRNKLNLYKDGCPISMNAFSLMVDNRPFLAGKMMMSPEAINNDGALNICLIGSLKSRIDVIKLLLKILKGRHVELSNVQTWSAEALVIESDNEEDFVGDGDLICHSNKFRIQIVKGALKILSPAAQDTLKSDSVYSK
jgi:diacylglycerol kinase (ATP)